ncbi:twin-arginine translocation signal domain-containing protein, partial [Streptomyces sp. NPDC005904]|uniref:twin-arginine translocation signal domain-containing protein n=1 Tax=Streptomyces sp. NPDC005904 TaxID=3154570 RepID=UPI0033D32992
MVTRRGFIDGVSAAGAATLFGATPPASPPARGLRAGGARPAGRGANPAGQLRKRPTDNPLQ